MRSGREDGEDTRLIILQGFDEFMNLVIDDAVEVKQATKTEGESRRQLGAQSS